MKDPYDILHVAKDASFDDIKTAYRKLAMECHPDTSDKPDSDSEKIRDINGAYEILSDPIKRKQYDETGYVTPEIDPIESAAVGIFMDIIHKMIFLSSQDIASSLIKLKSFNEDRYKMSLQENDNKRKKVEIFRDGLIQRSANDYIGIAIEAELHEIEAERKNIELQRQVDQRALSFFDGYIFKKNIPNGMYASNDLPVQLQDFIRKQFSL
jgi:DnaJ-class molecular chaperone